MDRHTAVDNRAPVLSAVSSLPSSSSSSVSTNVPTAWLFSPEPSSSSYAATSAPYSLPVGRPDAATADFSNRRSLWPLTASAALLGGTAGAAHSIYSGYPLQRAVAQSAFNWALVTFSYLGSSLLCAELAGLPASSLPNQLAAGSLTFATLLSLQAAAQGRITSLAEARRVGVRATAVGAVCGCGVWGLQQLRAQWRRRDGSQQTSTASSTPWEVEERQQQVRGAVHAEEVSGSGSESEGDGWLPAWSPVRVSTDDDLARADRVKAERTKRAHELQQQRREQQRQQRELDKQAQLG